jgi:glucose-1-phosphatase
VIKNIIFDLGNVLVHVDFARTKKLLINAGVSDSNFNRFFGKGIRRDFESGKITTSEFMNMAFRELGGNVPKSKLKELFEDMFDEIPEMKSFLKNLARSGKFKLFLLSNTNPLHFNYIRKKFGYVNLVYKFVLSYRLKMIKPGKRIYTTVLEKYRLKPEETLFIDDLKDNCFAAQKCGMQTINYKNYNSFVKEFKKLISN